jgi:endonuclease YncB( thermonuclease family)
MFGINTPELMGATMQQAKVAQQFLEKLLKASVGTKLLRMKSFKDQDDKYGGRVLGELWLPVTFKDEKDPKSAFVDPKGVYTNLNQLLIKSGLATAYFGVGEKV